MSVVRGTNDPAYVRAQYKTEVGLAARKAAYRDVAGQDASQVAFDAIVAGRPSRILEVGCGQGELAERLTHESDADVVAVDQSERMVELTRARGVDVRVADVQELPFADESFDAALAAWMLYHVPDLPRAIGELARVLVPGGRLVAVTNAADHLRELFALGGIERWDVPFGAENAAELLAPRFVTVERIDVDGEVVFEDIQAVRAYYASSARLEAYLDRLPAELDEPLVARRRPVVFIATKTLA
jgi:SAM-dependent methyltransferase